jgi:hypothetical protein
VSAVSPTSAPFSFELPQGFELAFEGRTSRKPSGPAFEFDSTSVFATNTDATLNDCARFCQAISTCAGFLISFPSIPEMESEMTCQLLDALGPSSGKATERSSFSLAKPVSTHQRLIAAHALLLVSGINVRDNCHITSIHLISSSSTGIRGHDNVDGVVHYDHNNNHNSNDDDSDKHDNNNDPYYDTYAYSNDDRSQNLRLFASIGIRAGI